MPDAAQRHAINHERPLSERKGTRASETRSQGHAGGDEGPGGLSQPTTHTHYRIHQLQPPSIMDVSPLPQNTQQQRERARVRATGGQKGGASTTPPAQTPHPTYPLPSLLTLPSLPSSKNTPNPAQPLLIHNNKIPKIPQIPKIPVQTNNHPQHLSSYKIPKRA